LEGEVYELGTDNLFDFAYGPCDEAIVILGAICFAVPLFLFGKTVYQNWEVVRWVHFGIPRNALTGWTAFGYGSEEDYQTTLF